MLNPTSASPPLNLTAPEIRSLVLHRQDRRRRNAQAGRKRDPTVHRRVDRDGVGSNRYACLAGASATPTLTLRLVESVSQDLESFTK